VSFIFLGCSALSQTEPQKSAPAPAHPGATTQAQNPCISPSPLVSVEDYTGPLHRVVLFVARKPEIKTVQRPSLSVGTICALTPRQKFHLFFRNTFEPITVVSAGFNAGLDQAEDTDPTYGQGAEGYGKRFGAELADRTSSDFFRTFLFPVIFHQDPRYYRMGHGTRGARLGNALTHVFVARTDSGKKTFNFSEWMGTAASVALGNTYHPGNERGLRPAGQRIAVSVGTDVGFDLLREFWPELIRKLKLPFRNPDQPSPGQPMRK
jgi:hypothetical protein